MTNAYKVSVASALAAYLLRALWKRVDWTSIGKERRRGINEELSGALLPIAIAERSTLGWCRALCTRFQINPSGGGFERDGVEMTSGPVCALVPRQFLPGDTPELEANGAGDGVAKVRWDILCTKIDFHALRIVLHENPAFFATFASAPPAEGEEQLFQIEPDTAGAQPWLPQLPKQLIPTRVHRTVWTLLSPFHHGADEKSGNVAMLRRERAVSPLTGEQYLRPFLSGNAWRGALRDRIFGLLIRRAGLSVKEIPPSRAHALLSGGVIETGADGGTVNVAARDRAREMPAWDLIAGCIDQQIMEGCLRAHDSHLVCRENAWFLHEILRPSRDGKALSVEEFAAALPAADDLTQLRLGTRHAHRDIEGSQGSQMLFNVEAVLPGAQMVHSFQLSSVVRGVPELTASCLADALDDLRDDGFMGALTGRAYGRIAFDPYKPGGGHPELPSPEIYRLWVTSNVDKGRTWLLDAPQNGRQVASADKPKRGRAKVIHEVI